jgi:putative ABC transport system permease protein
MRSVLTALGIIIGVASVIMMVALSQGATAGITERISSMGTNILMVNASGGFGVNRGAGGNTLKMEDAEAIARLPYVKNVAPLTDTNATVTAGSLTWNVTINGTTPALSDIRGFEFTSGQFFTGEDVEQMNMVAVIGQTVVENLYPGIATPVGSTMRINGLNFIVGGVIASQGSTAGMGMDQDNIVYIPITTAHQR